ncbi:O-antigen ligase family protein [Croceibacterium aestuarii]|uniref:O-antigen ligase family protein n=1 Tax=Croceibacterium aestuarii TaxID=3064139 RepID=UPI00272E347A|nr:O-antigen ligase family protein [Croceibacterium sp. D39]
MVVAWVFFSFLLMFGGGARADALSQALVRMLAILIIATTVTNTPAQAIVKLRGPLLLFAGVVLLVVAQLVPLPPGIWSSLGDRARFQALSTFPGIDLVWRPLSLNPDGTLNTLVSLLPVLASILVVADSRMRSADRTLLMILLGFIGLSGLVGLLQFASGGNDLLYPYRITNHGSAVGLFANRNHQAAALACALPLLAGWLTARRDRTLGIAVLPALSAVLLVIALILMTGSRAGFLLMLVGLAGAALQLWRSGKIPLHRISPKVLLSGVTLLLIVLAAAGLLLRNAESTKRLLSQSVQGDLRLQVFQPLVELAFRYMPLGTGFGTFPDVYKVYEPKDLLMFQYLNHAHDDLLELAIEAGIPGLALLALLLIWWGVTVARLWRRGNDEEPLIDLARAGSVGTGLLLLASVVDYPLRTPALGAIFAILCCWMYLGGRRLAALRN